MYNEVYNEFSKLYKEAIEEKNKFANTIIIDMPDHIFSIIITPDQDVIIQNYDYKKNSTETYDEFVDRVTELTNKYGRKCKSDVSFWSRDYRHISYCYHQTEQFIIEILRRAEKHEGELTMEFFEGVIESLLAKEKLTFKFNELEKKLEKVSEGKTPEGTSTMPKKPENKSKEVSEEKTLKRPSTVDLKNDYNKVVEKKIKNNEYNVKDSICYNSSDCYVELELD